MEGNVYIPDRFPIGTAQMMVTQPRTPCYKLVMVMAYRRQF